MEIKELSIDKIVGSVYQPRQQPHKNDRLRLMRSILANGLKVPIIVVRAAGGFKLVCGHRRVDALFALLGEGNKALPVGVARINRGKVMVQAVVLGSRDGKEAAITSFVENHERVNLTPYEDACCYKAFTEEIGFTRKELAGRLEVSRGTLDYLISALDGKSLKPVMIKAWKERKLREGHVIALFRLREYRKEQQQLFTRIIKERLNAEWTKFYCNQLLKPKDKRLDRQELDRFEQGALACEELVPYFKNQHLGLRPSIVGEQMNLKFSGVDDLERKLEAMLAFVKRMR